MPDSLAEAVHAARARLAAAGIEGPDAELLAAWSTRTTLGQLRADMVLGKSLGADALAHFATAVARRAARVPLQHITGLAPFRHIELQVGPGVFTPRPETEGLVDAVLGHLQAQPRSEATVLDVGTGSAAVAISVARESSARVIAVERSPAAFVWARRNIAALAPEVLLLHADALDATALASVGVTPGSLDVLVSNPPYVPHASIPGDHEVRAFDPEAALYSGADGLDFVRALIPLAASLVAPGGLVAFEHTEQQGKAIRTLCTDAGFRDAETLADLTGRDRVTRALR